jgi:hypothetical protein
MTDNDNEEQTSYSRIPIDDWLERNMFFVLPMF